MNDDQNNITAQVKSVLDIERSLSEFETELMKDDRFRSFLERQKEAKQQIDATWKSIEQAMIDNNVKSIKGDFGSITIAERTTFETTDELSNDYKKLVPDTKKIGTYYSLTNEAPAGATPKVTRYITKRLK